MKKFLLICFSLIACLSFGQQQELKLAADVWPPFTNVQGEKSILSDLVKEALLDIQIESTLEIKEFKEVLEKVNSGEYDGSPGLWISEERKEKYFFSKPYLYNQLVLVGRKGADVSAVSFDQLSGKKIGVIKNYAYGEIENNNIEIIQGISNQKNLEKLLSDKIDYMLVDALLIQYMLKHQLNDVTQHLAIGQEPLLVKSLHLALSKKAENAEEILLRFDEQIEKMIADGSFNELLGLNWIKADVDGDGNMEMVLGGNMAGTSAPQNIYGLMMDNSYKDQKNGPIRYYVDGKLYEDWDNIPKSYKLDLVEDNTPSAEDAYIRLDF